jgi:acetylornithine deacetylase
MTRTGVDLTELTRRLVDIDSTTGREGEAGRWLASYLRELGLRVTEQPVDDQRFNIIATLVASPAVVLSTHFDCVPPFFPSRVDRGRIYGRGSCDAKGILAAQVAAVDQLRRDGEERVGLLFVVGEERLGLATRGILRLKLRTSGRAAHSSFPELGESAIDKLLDALITLRSIALPHDSVLGRTHYSVGLIAGGVAPNVVSPAAEAEVMFRTVGDASHIRTAIASLEQHVTIEHVLEVPPVKLTTVPGFDSAVFPYTTDIPFLNRWGQPLLYGPGSIHAAHTADEFIEIDELQAAVAGYVRIARELLTK